MKKMKGNLIFGRTVTLFPLYLCHNMFSWSSRIQPAYFKVVKPVKRVTKAPIQIRSSSATGLYGQNFSENLQQNFILLSPH